MAGKMRLQARWAADILKSDPDKKIMVVSATEESAKTFMEQVKQELTKDEVLYHSRRYMNNVIFEGVIE